MVGTNKARNPAAYKPWLEAAEAVVEVETVETREVEEEELDLEPETEIEPDLDEEDPERETATVPALETTTVDPPTTVITSVGTTPPATEDMPGSKLSVLEEGAESAVVVVSTAGGVVATGKLAR
jgi:hypothetical protein